MIPTARPRLSVAAAALALVLALALALAQQSEDRPLPTSPCPEVFSYEGATVDWDRWYGVVLVATDIPLTGLRLDIWLSRPALALRHNWDGAVETKDNQRYTILNLYKRVEPGPPKSVRIVVKFDEHEDIPLLQAIELNGRRICTGRVGSPSLRQPPQPRPTSEPEPYEPEEEGRRPVHSKYNFDRTTRRTSPQHEPPAEYGGYDDYKNTVSRTPPSHTADPSRERPPARRPAYTDLGEIDEYVPAPAREPAYHHTVEAAPPRGPAYVDEEPPSYAPSPPRSERPNRRPAAEDGIDDYGGRPPTRHTPDTRYDADDVYRTTTRRTQAHREPEYERPTAATRRPEYATEREEPARRRPEGPPTTRKPAPTSSQRPATRAKDATTRRSDPGTTSTAPVIDVRINPQPLSSDDERVYSSESRYPTVEADEPAPVSAYGPEQSDRPSSGRPTRQPAPANDKHRGGPPGLAGRGPPGHNKGNGGPPGLNKGNGGGPPGLGGNLPPGHNKPGHGGGQGGQWQDTTPWTPGSTTTERPHRPTPPISTAEECGKVLSATPLVTYGQNTSRGQWPWHVALYQAKGTDLQYICGGTLVSDSIVVTAAHCVTRVINGRPVDPETILVYAGKYHLQVWTNEEGVQQSKVAKIHVHPEYNNTDFRSDVALLILSTTMRYSQYVRQVCLWGRGAISLDDIAGHEGYVAGWGYDENGELTEDLRMARMPIVAQQTCLWSYPDFFTRFTNNMTFCAGFKNGTSVCNGDSGGGMVLPQVQKDGTKRWFLRGLVSTSVSREDKRVCNTKHYVVFTDLAKFQDWIQNYIR